jgi:hypothetical protein
MTTAITAYLEQEHHVAQALAQLTPQRLWPRDSPRDLVAIERAIDALTEEVSPVWLMARIAALLSPYYEKDVPQSVREMELEDWAAALGGYPQWAIERAVRWWKGQDNPDRKRRPMEGDIAAKCHEYMDGVRAGQRIIAYAEPWPPMRIEPPKREPPCSPEAAAEIIAKAGFSIRRMG